jgi:hypothetical protein
MHINMHFASYDPILLVELRGIEPMTS